MVGHPSLQAGAYPSQAFAREYDERGEPVYSVVPSKQVKQAIEDNDIQESFWNYRRIFSGGSPPPKSWLPPGAKNWVWRIGKQAWVPDNYSGNFFTFGLGS
jgi:hypothetical protein